MPSAFFWRCSFSCLVFKSSRRGRLVCQCILSFGSPCAGDTLFPPAFSKREVVADIVDFRSALEIQLLNSEKIRFRSHAGPHAQHNPTADCWLCRTSRHHAVPDVVAPALMSCVILCKSFSYVLVTVVVESSGPLFRGTSCLPALTFRPHSRVEGKHDPKGYGYHDWTLAGSWQSVLGKSG